MSGVPTMATVGGIIGAMESNNPIKIATSVGLGGAAQAGFNVIGKAVAPLGKVGGAIMGGLGGFLGRDFGKTVANAVTEGQGTLSPANIPGVRGNEGINTAVGTAVAGVLQYAGGIPGVLGGAIADYTEVS